MTQLATTNSYSSLYHQAPTPYPLEPLSPTKSLPDSHHIRIEYLKTEEQREEAHLSIHKKQSKSPHTVVIKNQSRQILGLLSTNRHYNSLLTYESDSYEKKIGCEVMG